VNLPAKTGEATTWEETLFQNLYRLIQAVSIHQDNNQLVKVCVERFRETIAGLELEEDLKLWLSEGRFYVQTERLHYRNELVRIIHARFDFRKKTPTQAPCAETLSKALMPPTMEFSLRTSSYNRSHRNPCPKPLWLRRSERDAWQKTLRALLDDDARHQQPPEVLRPSGCRHPFVEPAQMLATLPAESHTPGVS